MVDEKKIQGEESQEKPLMEVEDWVIKLGHWRMGDIRRWTKANRLGIVDEQYSLILDVVKVLPFDIPLTPAGLDQLLPREYNEIIERVSAAAREHFQS